MQKQRLVIVISVFAGFLLSSCTPLYLPNTANTPMFTGKGEFQAAVHSGISGVDPQLAYAATDNVGLILNASIPASEESEHKYPFIEMGAGYYNKFSKHAVFEVYGGYGYRSLKTMGSQNYYDEDEYHDVSADLQYSTRFFVQPTIGVTSKIIDVGFTPRFAFVNIVDEYDKQNGLFFEPIITAKVGYKFARLVIQGGASTSFSKDIVFDYQPLMFSVGLQFSLNRQYD